MSVSEVRTENAWERAFYLGSDEPLFVVAHEPDGCDGRAVVLCSPLFTDQIANYNREVALARALAARGVACVRFHYRFTGCSGGDPALLTFESTVLDSAQILAFARSQWVVVGALGTRLSVHIAAAALRDAPGVPFVAWAPAITSRQYFRDAFRARLALVVARRKDDQRSAGERLEREGAVDLAGTRLAAATYNSFQKLDFTESLASTSGPALVVDFDGGPAAGPLNKRVDDARAGGRNVSFISKPQDETWWFLSEKILAWHELIDTTVDWLIPHLSDAAAAAPQRHIRAVPAPRLDRATFAGGVTETPVYIPADDMHVFAVLAQDATVAASWAVLQLWGAGGYPNFGPDGFRARISRVLANRGCADLRIDYGGTGESTGTHAEINLRAPRATDARAAGSWLRATFPGIPTLLIASCYGTRVALQLTDTLDPAGVVLIDPPVRDDGELESAVAQKGFRFIVTRVLDRSTLRGWFYPATRNRRFRIARRTLGILLKRALKREQRAASTAFLRPMQDLIDRGVRVLIVTLGEKPHHREFSEALRGPLGELIASRAGQVEVRTLAGVATLRDSPDVQDELLAAMTEWHDRHFCRPGLPTASGLST